MNIALIGSGGREHALCQKIYESIGTFVLLADTEWKKEKEKKAMFYSTAASNYATIYETVCSN